jgi:hypothetical protein
VRQGDPGLASGWLGVELEAKVQVLYARHDLREACLKELVLLPELCHCWHLSELHRETHIGVGAAQDGQALDRSVPERQDAGIPLRFAPKHVQLEIHVRVEGLGVNRDAQPA